MTDSRKLCMIVVMCFLAVLSSGCTLGQSVGATVGASVGTAALSERGLATTVEDFDLKMTVSHSLSKAENPDFEGVSVEVYRARVLLVGTVPSVDARIEAGRVAWQTQGVERVLNELEVIPEGREQDLASDLRITAELRGNLLVDMQVLDVNFVVKTMHRTVYLLGDARTEDERRRVVLHARAVGGVRGIVSHVQVMPSEPPENTNESA